MTTNLNPETRMTPAQAGPTHRRWRTGMAAALVLVSLAFVAAPAWAGADDPASAKLDRYFQAILERADKGAQRVAVRVDDDQVGAAEFTRVSR